MIIPDDFGSNVRLTYIIGDDILELVNFVIGLRIFCRIIYNYLVFMGIVSCVIRSLFVLLLKTDIA